MKFRGFAKFRLPLLFTCSHSNQPIKIWTEQGLIRRTFNFYFNDVPDAIFVRRLSISTMFSSPRAPGCCSDTMISQFPAFEPLTTPVCAICSTTTYLPQKLARGFVHRTLPSCHHAFFFCYYYLTSAFTVLRFRFQTRDLRTYRSWKNSILKFFPLLRATSPSASNNRSISPTWTLCFTSAFSQLHIPKTHTHLIGGFGPKLCPTSRQPPRQIQETDVGSSLQRGYWTERQWESQCPFTAELYRAENLG